MADWPAALSQGRYTAIGEVASSSNGTTVTASATTNTKGSYAELEASTPNDCDGFIVAVDHPPGPADHLLDIAIGAAGSEIVIVPDMLVSGADAGVEYAYIPVPIKAGTRVAARSQSTDASDAIRVTVYLVAGGWMASAPCGRVTNYGSAAADSGGVGVDPGGTANTKGSYAEISAALTHPTKYLVVMVGSRNNTVIGADIFALLDIAVGGAGSEQVVVPDLFIQANASTDAYGRCWICLPLTLKAGERVAARLQSNSTDATDRLIDVALLGIN